MFFIQAFFVKLLTPTNSNFLEIMKLLVINDFRFKVFLNFRINKNLRA